MAIYLQRNMQDNQQYPSLNKGGIHQDQRGEIIFFNDFDMSAIKRFYQISNADETIKRGWRAHKIEQRWFYAVTGAFKIGIVKIDNFNQPNPNVNKQVFMLDANRPEVLHIPIGYASCVIAMEENSRLLVYANYPIAHAANDDYLYNSNYFGEW